MSYEIRIEPARFGRTGCGIGSTDIRFDFFEAADGYQIDAPEYTPRGSVRGRLHLAEYGMPTYQYLSTTEPRA